MAKNTERFTYLKTLREEYAELTEAIDFFFTNLEEHGAVNYLFLEGLLDFDDELEEALANHDVIALSNIYATAKDCYDDMVDTYETIMAGIRVFEGKTEGDQTPLEAAVEVFAETEKENNVKDIRLSKKIQETFASAENIQKILDGQLVACERYRKIMERCEEFFETIEDCIFLIGPDCVVSTFPKVKKVISTKPFKKIEVTVERPDESFVTILDGNKRMAYALGYKNMEEYTEDLEFAKLAHSYFKNNKHGQKIRVICSSGVVAILEKLREA